MLNHDLERVHKIKKHCLNIQKTLQTINFDDFKSENGVDARDMCAFRLFQIGEHVNELSDNLKEQYPDFKWGAVYRFRNVLGHDYEGVSFNAIWKSCKNDIPKLMNYIDRIINEAEPDSTY
jgi:uncharacterized protein with HEPN domain